MRARIFASGEAVLEARSTSPAPKATIEVPAETNHNAEIPRDPKKLTLSRRSWVAAEYSFKNPVRIRLR